MVAKDNMRHFERCTRMVVAFSEDAAVLPWRPGVVLILRVAYWRCNMTGMVADLVDKNIRR